MNLGTAFAIGATLLGTFGGGSGQSTSTSGSGGTGDALGFIKQGARAFNLMRKGGSGYGDTPAPFATDVAFRDTGSYYKKFGSAKSTSVSTPEFSQYRVQNVDVNSAIKNLYANAQNQQMRQLLAQYGGPVPTTLQQGRKTQALEQASLGTISV